MNLLKETKDLYAEKYKTVMKEITDETNRWRDIPCSWVERINIVKITTLPKAIYTSNAIPMKSINAIFHGTITKKNSHNLYGNTNDPEQPEQSRGRRMELEKSTFLTSDYMTKLHHQDRMTLAQKQKYRPVEQDREPRDKPTHLWAPYL